jgi:hypothetical protein
MMCEMRRICSQRDLAPPTSRRPRVTSGPPAFRWVPGFEFRWVPGFAFGWVPECRACADAAWQAEDVARGTQNPIRCAEGVVLVRGNGAFDTQNPERCAEGAVSGWGNVAFSTQDTERCVKSGISSRETPLWTLGFANVVSKAACASAKRRLRRTEHGTLCQRRRIGKWKRCL